MADKVSLTVEMVAAAQNTAVEQTKHIGLPDSPTFIRCLTAALNTQLGQQAAAPPRAGPALWDVQWKRHGESSHGA